MYWCSKWPGKPGLVCKSFRSSLSCYLATWGCTWQQREKIICPLQPSLAGKAMYILDVSCSKLEEFSNRDDNEVRMWVSGKMCCLHHQVELVLPQGRRMEEETSGVLPALGPAHLYTRRMWRWNNFAAPSGFSPTNSSHQIPLLLYVSGKKMHTLKKSFFKKEKPWVCSP